MDKVDYSQFNMKALGAPDEEHEDMRLDDSSVVTERMLNLLEECNSHYQSLKPIRDRRRRNRNYYRGKQWADEIYDPVSGTYKTEEQYLLEQGKQPLVNNQIRQLVKNLLGQFRDNDYKPQAIARSRDKSSISEMMTNAIQYVYQINELREIDVRTFEEFLTSGIVAWKSSFSWMPERNIDDVEVDAPNVNKLFWNADTMDIRGKDITLIGEIIDAPLDDIISTFAKNEEEERVIRGWYGSKARYEYLSGLIDTGSDRIDNDDFLYSLDYNTCRYFEIWRKEYKRKIICHDWLKGDQYQHPLDLDEALEQIEIENTTRLLEAYNQFTSMGMVLGSFDEFIESEQAQQIPLIEYEIKNNEPVWCFYMVTPEGHVLDHGETPYEHESHPYTLRLFPLIDGEVWGFIEDIIDQQKMINRMVTLIDFVISAGAKGVMMIPEDAIPEGMTEEDFTDQAHRVNGVIVYKPTKTGAKPEMVYNKSLPAGATELLSIQLNLMKEISGVTGAIQGQTPNSGTPAARYAMETQNAAIASKDYFEHFFSARKNRDYKNLKLIKQFYQEDRFINVAGINYSDDAAIYKPELVSDVDFDMVIGKSANAPVFRMMIDDTLQFLLEKGVIDAGMFLENTSLPFADKLIQQIKDKEQELAQMQQQAGGGNEQAQQMIAQMFNQNKAA